jgi:hypothetical protein
MQSALAAGGAERSAPDSLLRVANIEFIFAKSAVALLLRVALLEHGHSALNSQDADLLPCARAKNKFARAPRRCSLEGTLTQIWVVDQAFLPRVATKPCGRFDDDDLVIHR